MPGVDDWLSAARGDSPDDLREKILTGYKAGKPFLPYEPTIALPAQLGRILDFGCGLGRNFPLLTRLSGTVVGFDLPPMIDRCRQLPLPPTVSLSDDWDVLRRESFDLIYAALVLQHIDTGQSLAYLRDCAAMSPRLYLLTRASTDFQRNLLQLVVETGAFDEPDCTVVEHDDVSHQLKVLGRVPFREACRSTGDHHYEMLLNRRI
jgi:SAM-dependent methyltransferase